MAPVTKYLLLVPAAYIAYCAYADYAFKQQKVKIKHEQQSQSIRSLHRKFNRSSNSLELTNILKKTFLYLRGQITEPGEQKTEIIDCQVLDAERAETGWINPISTRNLMVLNRYNRLENRKEGYFSIFFWFDVLTKQHLKLVNADAQIDNVREMLEDRENKCLAIAKKNDPNIGPEFENYFVQCLRKSQGPARIIERELARIELMKTYQSHE